MMTTHYFVNAQIAQFQLKQMERVMTYHKKKSLELERRLKEVTEECYRWKLFFLVLHVTYHETTPPCEILSSLLYRLKKENAELKKPLSQWRVI